MSLHDDITRFAVLSTKNPKRLNQVVSALAASESKAFWKSSSTIPYSMVELTIMMLFV